MGRAAQQDPGSVEHFCPAHRIYIIADAGSNHAGSFTLGKRLINDAAWAGADAIKFQLFHWEDIVDDPELRDPRYEIPEHWIAGWAHEARLRGLDFLCTPFAPWAIEVLRPHVAAWKIGSFEANRWDLVRATEDKVRLISCGMLDNDAYCRLLHTGLENWVPLHCVSRYPTKLAESALYRLASPSPHKGISDHTAGWDSVLVAIGMGARTVEKHLALLEQPDTPDSGPWALRPYRFREMVITIRDVEKSLHSNGFDLPGYPGRKVHACETKVV